MKKCLIGVLAALTFLAACGGSNKDTAKPDTSTTPGNTSGGSGNEGGSGSSAFTDLIAKVKTQNFKVTYTTDGGKTQTIAQDGKGRTSYQSGDSLLITDGSKTISCNGTDSSATCQEVPLGNTGIASAATSLFTSAYASLGALNSSLFNGHTSSETIAGRDASCVTLSASDIGGGLGGAISKATGDASVTSCIDKEKGVLLKYSTTLNGTTTDQFVATEFGEASDSDFTPPSTPKPAPTLPTLPNGITLPSLPTG